MVHRYNGVLLSTKKWICVSSSKVEELRACYTGWSKLEGSKNSQKQFINVYICNLEKWYWWMYLQGRNRDADMENGLVDTVGEGKSGTNRK